MDKIIATVVVIVLTLGLISYAIIGQIGGVKDAGDQVSSEQNRLNIMMSNPDIVSGSTVKEHQGNALIKGFTVSLQNEKGEVLIGEINDKSLFVMKKTILPNGKLTNIDFKLVDLSSTN